MTRIGCTLAVAAFGVLLQTGMRAQSEGFVPLFDGTLRSWTVENTTAGNFTVADGVLRVEGPTGWLRSERRYGNFVLRTEFRFVTADADSGVFVRVAGDTAFMRGWPNNSYQVQVRNPETPHPFFPHVGGLFRHGTPDGSTTYEAQAVERAFTGTGAWQTLEIEVAGDTLVARLNGTEVLRAGTIGNSPGYIGIQGESGVVEYRTIEIREL